MPFAAPMLDDENDPKKNPNGGVNISGQSTTVSTGVPGQEAAVPGAKQKTSGQYTNIQTYLDANKEQGDQMGGKIADDVSNKAEDATQKIGAYEAKAPTVQAYDPNEAIGRATSLSDAEKATYKTNKATGGYSGPQTVDGIEGYADANKAGTEAATAVKSAGTEAGQRELLKQTYARPQYSAGENNLDQALVQGSAGSRSRMEELGQKYSGLDSALGNANTKVGNAVNSAITQSYNNRQAFTPAEEAARKALIDPIQARANQANATNSGYIDNILNDASDETLSDETLKALGLSEGQNLYDINLRDYVNQDRSQVGLNNAATADERSKYAALQSLFDDPTMSQITADGKTINPVSFNKSKFDTDQAAKDQAWKTLYNDANSGSFDRYVGQNGINAQFMSGLSSQLKNKSLAQVESELLPYYQEAGKTNQAYQVYGADPIKAYLDWAKNSNNVNRKVTKG